ncbi:hypothetical protein RB195_004485 [Necator americanus]|uniref:MARVEL domain-containing protein n=2 Tax=Necator americanus TaxID=51031 RepID=A0ABR1BLM0_NECAM
MNVGDDQAQPDVVFRADELLESKFIVHYRRSEISSITEIGFAAILLIFGIMEIILYKEQVCGYCLICFGFLLFCLSIQFYFGVIFNCWPLLICHSVVAASMCISIFILLMCSLLMSYPAQIVNLQYRVTAVLVITTSVIALVLLATFAVTSFSRGKELWAFEVSHTDHLRRLLIEALEALEEYRQEHSSASDDD